ncbi:MAG TPA: T9SS type A sorting domain-containing protein [Flavobacteriales bacterium]|nr:T9SS type A sorting domain-containing protein [Flavobacteriales bacterium]
MKLVHYLFFLLLANLLTLNNSNAQELGAKDCMNAIPLENWETITYYSSEGEGDVFGEINTTSSCLTTGERNVAWFIFYTTSDGLVSFTIIPSCDLADYDFAVFDITNHGCSAIATNPELQISCDFSGSMFPTSSTGANNGTNDQDEPAIQAEAGRIYVLVVNNFSGVNMCGYSINFEGSTAQLGNFSEVIGHVNYDSNDSCGDGIELPIDNQKINILNQNGDPVGLTYTNETGWYNAFIPPIQNSVTLALDEVHFPFASTCFPAEQIVTTDTSQSVITVDFALRSTQSCTEYDFEYTVPFFRRCFSTTNFVNITNRGTTSSALDFTLTYPTDQIYPLSASVPFENIGNNTYLFHAPAINLFQELIVTILDTTTCENILGSFACVEGQLLTTNDCLDEDSTALKLALSSDSLTNTITVGNFGEVAMPNTFSLFVSNDYDPFFGMFLTSNEYSFTLAPNETFTANVFSENWTSVLIDNEGNVESLFISNVDNPYLSDTLIDLTYQTYDTECAMILGSYDPNDKQGFPEGYGELNRIESEQTITYRIRFQNTGSDTAFTVVVIDTLSEYLDYTSIIPGASSHPYTFYLENNILKFRFNHINLVQKSLNEPASIGFVEFKIKQKDSNPISYTIENQAAIYFDFNAPIFTPVHQYSIYPMPLGINEATSPIEMNVSPNPSTGNVAFYFSNKFQETQKSILVTDLSGRTIKTITTNEKSPNFNWNELPAGTYLITVIMKNGLRTSTRWTKI